MIKNKEKTWYGNTSFRICVKMYVHPDTEFTYHYLFHSDYVTITHKNRSRSFDVIKKQTKKTKKKETSANSLFTMVHISLCWCCYNDTSNDFVLLVVFNNSNVKKKKMKRNIKTISKLESFYMKTQMHDFVWCSLSLSIIPGFIFHLLTVTIMNRGETKRKKKQKPFENFFKRLATWESFTSSLMSYGIIIICKSLPTFGTYFDSEINRDTQYYFYKLTKYPFSCFLWQQQKQNKRLHRNYVWKQCDPNQMTENGSLIKKGKKKQKKKENDAQSLSRDNLFGFLHLCF